MRKRLPWDKEKREAILNRDNRTCIYCGSKKWLSLDHIIPIKLDGSDRADNIVTSCRTCNSAKNGNRLLPNYEKYVLELVKDRNRQYKIDNSLTVTKEIICRTRNQNRRGRKRVVVCTCKRLTGEDACPICLAERELERAILLISRIDTINVNLYTMMARTERDMKRMRELCYRHGYKYLSVPTGNNSEKFVVVDGKVKGSRLTDSDEVKTTLCNLVGVISEGRSVRVSGTLGMR